MTTPVAGHSSSVDRRLQLVAAALVGSVGVVVLIGWVADLRWATRIAPGLASMKPNTALALLLTAVGLVTHPPWRVVAAVVPGALAATALVEYALGTNVGVDSVLIAVNEPGPHPGRMAHATAICLLLLCLAITLPPRRFRNAAQLSAVLVIVVAGIGVLGYLYGVRSLYSTGAYSSIALHTALALVVLAVAVLAAVPDGFLPWVLHGPDSGALVLRRLLPAAVLGIPLIGSLRLMGEERLGWYDTQTGLGIMVMAAVSVVVGVGLYTARLLAKVDQRRERALTALTVLNDDLERRVQQRALELEAERGRTAVLTDRQRIAADLHDHVIQGLFAAGMRLAADAAQAGRLSEGAGTSVGLPPEAIDRTVGMIDEAIGQLRATIHALTEPVSRVPLSQLLTEIVGGAGTGELTATLTTSGPVDDIPQEIAGHVSAVVREAVTNVLRHARAQRLEVSVEVEERGIKLQVADDGVGMPADTARESGVANLRRRAEQLGGECGWVTSGRGTTLTWRVPRPTGRDTDSDAHHQLSSRNTAAANLDLGAAMLAVSRDLLSAPMASQRLTTAVSSVASMVAADTFALIVPVDSDRLTIRAAHGLGDTEALLGRTFSRESSIAALAMERREPIVMSDVPGMASARGLFQQETAGTAVVVPVVPANGASGAAQPAVAALGLGRAVGAAPFTSDEIERALALAPFIALALDLTVAKGPFASDPGSAPGGPWSSD